MSPKRCTRRCTTNTASLKRLETSNLVRLITSFQCVLGDQTTSVISGISLRTTSGMGENLVFMKRIALRAGYVAE